MKIRNGFVSNSSASSFCIYGWWGKELKDTEYFEEGDADYPYFMNKLRYAIIGLDKDLEFKITSTESDNGDFIFGIGEAADDVDHGLVNGEYWEDFKFPPPDMVIAKKFEIVCEKLNLPKPHLESKTFWS